MAKPTPSAATPSALTTAAVDFDGLRPVSRTFGDVYHDADGATETARVFLEPADIAGRARRCRDTFTIGELGFGTGLNLLVTCGAVGGRLHFVSFELQPLSASDFDRALAPWRAQYPMARTLADAYPPLIPGWHRRVLDAGRVQLSVYFGDVADGLSDLARQQRRGVDAWFLDGFAPPKNPAMWRRGLFDVMAECSAARASVTTFTAAGQVRRDLSAAGFEVRRVDQRPHKRHSTAAVYMGTGRVFYPPAEVVVSGAGLAGAATARALAEKGIAALLLHGGEGLARHASAIPAAVMHPRLTPDLAADAGFRAHAYAFAAHRCASLAGVSASGALQLPGPTIDAERLHGIGLAVPSEIAELVDPQAATKLAGMPVSEAGLFFPAATTIHGARLVADLAAHAGVEVVASSSPGASPRVHATGALIDGFDTLEVTGLAGQIDRFRCASPPKLPILGDGAAVPSDGSVWAGATYEYTPWEPAHATVANARRYERLLGSAPGMSLERFRGVRAVTSDHLPVIGGDDGAWFNLGHGSHGTSTAIIGAEIVASAINGEVAPVAGDILDVLRPGRFRERQRRRANPFSRQRRPPGTGGSSG